MNEAITTAQQTIISEAGRKKRDAGEDALAYQLDLCGIRYQRQFGFAPGRKYRADFRIGKLLIEVQGGNWSRGRHVRGRGYENDCRRLNVATGLGWRSMWFTSDMVHSGEAVTVIESVVRGT